MLRDMGDYCNTASSWTWKDRFRSKCFPAFHCDLPEAPFSFREVITLQLKTELSFTDRIRVLVTGKLVTRVKVVTENEVSSHVANAVVFPTLNF